MTGNEKIELIAINIRYAIEKTLRERLPITFHDFPFGACGDTALILGRHLKDLGYGGFKYVLACRGDKEDGSWCSHVWLERQGLIVDITADQFSDFSHKVFVGMGSSFHSTFTVEDVSDADYEIYDSNTYEKLTSAHQEILKQLDECGDGDNI